MNFHRSDIADTVRDMTTAALTRDERWAAIRPLLKAMGQVIARDVEERLRPVGLTKPQAWLLLLLEPEGDGMPIAHLAEEMGCHSSNLTGVLDRLEARLAVRRVVHPRDRRVKMVRLTPAGAGLRQAAEAAISGAPASLDTLDDEDLATLEALLRKALAEGA
jgi:DNA-binding MarR family transcriptional regulator